LEEVVLKAEVWVVMKAGRRKVGGSTAVRGAAEESRPLSRLLLVQWAVILYA